MAGKNDSGSNPRNAESKLFKRLTRLFSGPIVNYRHQAIQRSKGTDPSKYTFRSNTGKEFKKKEHYNPFESIQAHVLAQSQREQRYLDFEQMEYVVEIASSLDIYADEITTSTEMSPLVSIDCQNQEIKDILQTLLSDVINVEFNMFGWARSLCKYGDYYLYMDIDEEMGITNVIPLPIREIERIEGKDPSNPNYVQYFWQSGTSEGVTFENWQLAHFRILGNDKYAPYGSSVLEPVRRVFRQLTLLEDAMMAYRVVRSAERRVFYIDIGNIPSDQVEQFMEQVKTQMKRNMIVDPETGRVDLRYNPMHLEEDFFIPTRGGESSRIETLAGGQITGDIEDVEYLRDKLFSGLKIPKSYLAQADASEDKATLAQKDIRFARTIQRIQRAMVSELEKICIVHLYTLGFRNQDLTSFNISLNNPSKIAELQELEHIRTKFEIAGAATDGFFSRPWVYKNIFKLGDAEVDRILQEQFFDKRHDAMLEEAAGELEAEAEGGDFGGGDFGGGEEDFDMGGDEEEPAEDEGDDTLLASPGKRDDDGYYTPGSKGKKYHPEKYDKRPRGARHRSKTAAGGQQTASSSTRNLFKGFTDGVGTLSAFGEGKNSTDKTDENLLFRTSHDITNLISELKNRDEKNDKDPSQQKT
jgi:hypothetical protein